MFQTGEKPHECDICKKTFSQKSDLVRHKRIHSIKKTFSLSHLMKMEGRMKDFSSNISKFVDCGEDVKLKNIKEEIKEDESNIDPSFIDYNTVGNIKQEIKEEVNEFFFRL